MNRFFNHGLRFSCTGCRYCCGVEPGMVFLSEEDASRLAIHLRLPLNEFLRTYCRKVPMGSISYVSLLEKEHFDCVFLGRTGCDVYDARPTQCRTYPFWASILETEEEWIEEAKSCPGIGKGELHSAEEIENLLALRSGTMPMIVENGPWN